MSGEIDEAGNVAPPGRACVLLSGGMDSTACLHWAKAKFAEVRAVGFMYGQPHRDPELVAAGKLAARRDVPFEVIHLADALHSGLLARVPEHSEGTIAGIHRAFVPGRNLVFLSLALSRACQWWEGDFALVIGCVKEDAECFPDCREKEFIRRAQDVLSAAVDRRIRVCAPYSKMSKARMLEDVAGRFPSGIRDIQESWSCYAGQGPCGTCTACVLRTKAFAEAHLPDLAEEPVMHGGDTHRDYLLKGDR